MNRLTTEAVQGIKAAQGIYRASDVARAYGCHRSTVTRTWDGRYHKEVEPSPSIPNLVSRNRPSELAEDIRILLSRGLTPEEVASMLGISRASVFMFRGVFV